MSRWDRFAVGIGKEGRRFARDSRGAAAASLVIGGVAMTMVVGLAVDTGNMEFARQKLQRALDAAVVSVASSETVYKNDSASEDMVQRYLKNAMGENSSIDSSVALEVVDDKIVIKGTAEMTVPSIVASLTGASSTIGVESSVMPKRSGKPVEIALVIDTSTSMLKYQRDLREALSSFVKEMVDPSSSDTKIALVPFSEQVCLDKATSQRQRWLVAPRSGWFRWEGCVGPREVSHRTTIADAQRLPYPAMARTGTDVAETNFVAMNMTRPLMPLTNDENKLLTRVGELTGFGMTYVLNGVIWGWHALSPEAPLEEALEDGQALKYLVIFSDGYNTKMATDAPRGSPEFGKTMAAAAQADTEMESACTLVKQDGIEVFVIYYAVNSDESFKSKLKSCAATASNYKEPELNAPGSIMKAFNEVKRQINNNIRLTQ